MTHPAEKDARCSRCDEVVGAVVTAGGRATIRLSTDSHGTTLPISCPRVIPPATCFICGKLRRAGSEWCDEHTTESDGITPVSNLDTQQEEH